MTDDTTTTTDAGDEVVDAVSTELVELLNPFSGEVLRLDELTTSDLLRAAERFDTELATVLPFRQALRDEVIARMDRRNKRTAALGSFRIEVNAPTEVDYYPDKLKAELTALVEAKVIDAEVLADVFVTPPPKPQAERIAKAEVNKLKGHDDPRVVAAIAAASVRKNVTRSLKFNRVSEDVTDDE